MNEAFWKRIIIGICITAVVVFLVLMVIIAARSMLTGAGAEEYWETRYVLCMDYVNARMSPNKKQDPIGRLETGDIVYTDGRKKNGYIHCVGLGFEATEGWVYAGYLTEDKPEKVMRNATIVSKGRLAARSCVGGKRTRWLKSGATVKVYYWSDSWSLTNCGYVMTKYLELDGE